MCSKPTAVFLLLILSIFLIICCGDQEVSEEDTLAVVNDKKISKAEFSDRMNRLRAKSGLVPNGKVRRELLKTLVDEQILIREAEKSGFDRDSIGMFEREKIETQELLRQFNIRQIRNKIAVNEKDLQALYVNLNTKIQARHLYAPTREKADSLYRALQEGASFEELAGEIFNDPALKNSGGMLGWFSLDEMDPAFEEAAYEMKKGEISRPVKTKDGYSIIKIEDREIKPMLTENDYNRHRDKLQKFLEKRQIKQKTKQFADSLSRDLDIVFNESYLKKMFAIVTARDQSNTLNEVQPGLPDEIDLPDDWIIRFKHGEWDLKKLKHYARFTSAKQRGWIKNEDTLKDFISGLAVRSVILQKAEDEGIADTREYKNSVKHKFIQYLLERTEKKLFFNIEIPKDSLYTYYNEAPERFASPAKINMREIVLGSETLAAEITSKLNKGRPFKTLARKYSIRTSTSQNDGEIGFLTSKDLGKWSETAFSLKKNEWTGPIKIDSLYVFLQCIEKLPMQILPFEEVRDNVHHVVKSNTWIDLRREKINELKKDAEIKSYPEKLFSLKLN